MRAVILLLFATSLLAQNKHEIGEIDGAKFRIDMPAAWNGGLVMYCHGWAATPGAFPENAPPNRLLNVFTDAGFAVAQSGYAGAGWAVEQAFSNTESLRLYFTKKYGAPKTTWLTGHSLGGFMTMMLMERSPGTYKAGLALCAPLAPASDFIKRTAFDGRALFDFYFPGTLPPLDKVPPSYRTSKEAVVAVLQAFKDKPAEAETLRRAGGQKSLEDLASGVVFATAVLGELEQRAGGNPFDNRDTVYTVDGDSNALNDGIKRYAADPRAAAYLRAWYTPTGKLSGPLLAIHTTYDPTVPTWIPATYQDRTANAGDPQLFVAQYVKHDGHCSITPDETAAGFAELRRWVDSGQAPTPGIAVPVNAVAINAVPLK